MVDFWCFCVKDWLFYPKNAAKRVDLRENSLLPVSRKLYPVYNHAILYNIIF